MLRMLQLDRINGSLIRSLFNKTYINKYYIMLCVYEKIEQI